MRKMLLRFTGLFGLSLILAFLPTMDLRAQAKPPIQFVAIHAQRYQDFTRNRILCEVFGEIKNLSNRPLKSVTIVLEFLDEKGKAVATEETKVVPRVISPGNPRGEPRPVRPQEIGNFIQDTAQCPEKWLEGRIQYRIKNAEWE